MEATAKRNIKITQWVNFFAGITFLVPIIEIFYTYTGLSIMEIVIVSNVFTLVTWIFEIPTSAFADTMGRKKSLMISVISNFLGALCILFFPHLWGFIIASFFSALYFCFWSGTEQAFIDENLKILGNQQGFGKVFGNNLFLQQLAGFITPVLASLMLKYFHGTGYTILAILDVIFAGILIILQYKIVEVQVIRARIGSFARMIKENIFVAKTAIINIRTNTNLKTLLLYRSLSSSASFFTIILLPTLATKGMPDWYSGFIVMGGTIAFMISSKFIYKIGEKYSYNLTWVLGTVAQGLLLIIVGYFFQSWVFIWIVFILMEFFEGFWQTSWNHILVEQSGGIAVATTRSIIFSLFALYATILKQAVSFLGVNYALLIIGSIILIANIFLGRKILHIKKKPLLNQQRS
ncbi:MAG: MFS transporter [candidate division SR1 bacterium]|nr:MFS transporter [candidate division SR1 bacterium]